MLPDVVHSGSPFSSELVRELTDVEFRHAYMMEQVRTNIAFQIRALREQRHWNQGDLARVAGKTQSVISRLEDPDYEKLGLQSCLEIAVAYDVPLLVQFVEWDDWLARMSNMSPSALRKRSFDAARLIEMQRRASNSAAANNPSEQPTMLRQLGLGSTIGGGAAAANDVLPERPSLSQGSLKRVAEGMAA
jgi:transcriptional regulator with XRE-family HTH domain